MKVHLLGPVRVVSQAGDLVAPASVAQRQLVALLALRAGDIVPMSVICSSLDLTQGAVRTTISRVRRLLGPSFVVTEPPGYALRAESDVDRFEQLVGAARSARAEDAIVLRTEALDLFRWEALPEFADQEWAMGAATRLNEIRANTVEDLAASLIEVGRRTDAIATLEPHVAAFPYRARPRELQMTALALNGRQSEALRLYQAYRRLLIDEVGSEPAASVREIEIAIATDRIGPGPAGRRLIEQDAVVPAKLPEGTVTFMLTDIERSTEAWERDAVAMGHAVSRHYEIIDGIVARHGGVRPEEQGEGDSTVTAFVEATGAVLAALDIQLAFGHEAWPSQTPIRIKIALHTGDAKLRNDSNYAGLTIIRAARLRNLAQGGQILVSSALRTIVSGTLPAPMSLRDLGRHQMKGLDGAERIYQLQHPGLATEFAPSHALESTPTNLPRHPTTFVGRADELRELDELLARHRLVTVTGSGGAGKTRIAGRAAHDQLDRFTDGVWWVELAAVTESSSVARVVADVLRVRVDDHESTADSVVRRLGADVSLIVLDNAEHLADAVADLVSEMLTRCPNLTILVTTRRVLGVAGEFSWRLPSLSLPPRGDPSGSAAFERSDSMQLFLDRAETAGTRIDATGSDGPTIAEICRRLDGMPLAIELAAARTRVLAPRQILGGLADALGLLTRGGRTALARHQTLDASIAWSIDLLNDQERTLLARLSIFAGSFDLDAVAEVCMVGEGSSAAAQALDVIEGLIDHSLVTPVGGIDVRRLSLLEVVRQFGARILDAFDETTMIRDRHSRYFATLAGQFGALAETADERLAVTRLEAEAGNIEAALIWYRNCGASQELAGLVSELAPYWNMTAANADSETWLTCALSAMPAQPSQTRARLHAYRALTRSNTGDYGGSLADCRSALDLGGTVGDRWSIGRARWVIADVAAYGNLEAWRSLSDQALGALSESGDVFAEGYARVWQATPYLLRGHLHVGLTALEAATAKVAEVKNPSLSGSHLAWQAWAAFCSGEFRRSEQIASEALAGPGFRLASQRYFVEMISISAALHRGRDHPFRNEFERTTSLALRQGEVLAARMNEQAMVGWLLFSDPAAALAAARRLLPEMPQTYKVGLCETNLHAAWACVSVNDLAAARRHVDQAIAVGSVANWPLTRTRRMAIESMISTSTGDLGHAIAVADAAVVLAEAEGLRVAVVHALETRALAAAAGDDLIRVAEIVGLVSTMRERMEYAEVFLPLSLPMGRAVQLATSVLGSSTFGAHRARGSLLTARDVIGPSDRPVGAGGESAR